MSLYVKNKEVLGSTTVLYNNIAVSAIYYNGTLVWPPVDTTCTVCGGSGTVSGTCQYCNVYGECGECLGKGYVTVNHCPSCIGTNVGWLCAACGYNFTWSDAMGGFTCRCGVYYSGTEDAGVKCTETPCPQCVAWERPGYVTETCPFCNGDGICSYCGGDHVLSGTCPTCNGTGDTGSGSSTQD